MARAMVGTLEMASLVAIEQWFEAAKKKKLFLMVLLGAKIGIQPSPTGGLNQPRVNK